MIFVILAIIACFIFISIYSKKFQSPFLLIFLFGKKGAGKSSLMVYYMIKHLKAGWTVYTDLEGIKIDGIRVFDIKQLNRAAPPPRSLVCLDEVGLSMDNREYKSFTTGLRDFYALQRHYKCKVIVNSQAFDVDKKVRDRVDQFLFLQKIAGCITLVRPIIQTVRPNDMTTADCDSPVASKFRWGSIFSWRFLWLPKYAKFFDSFIAPERPQCEFTEVVSDCILDKPNRFLSWLNKRRR